MVMEAVLRLLARSERRFLERERRRAEPVPSDSGVMPFRYYPGGGSMGFLVTAIPPGSRVAQMFEAEFGPGSLEVAKRTPGWTPASRRV